MLRAVAILLAVTGCGRFFGLDRPTERDDASTSDGGGIVDTVPDGLPDSPPGTATLTFQQGAGGYLNASDTTLSSSSPGSNNSGDNDIKWRETQKWGLLQFSSIFGATRIPDGAVIVAATLEVHVNNTNQGPASLHEATFGWIESVTYNTFGPSPGVDASEIGGMIGTIPDIIGVQTVNVKLSLERWSGDPSTRFGWILVGGPNPGGGDSSIRSSNEGLVANRPKLTVTYMTP